MTVRTTGARLPWGTAPGGNGARSLCAWAPRDIQCDATGRVVTLDLHNKQLAGTLPFHVALLEKLERLFLFANELSGTIPSGVGNLWSLTDLALNANNFVGPIPGDISAIGASGLGSSFSGNNGWTPGLAPTPAGMGCAASISPLWYLSLIHI